MMVAPRLPVVRAGGERVSRPWSSPRSKSRVDIASRPWTAAPQQVVFGRSSSQRKGKNFFDKSQPIVGGVVIDEVQE